MLEKHSNAIEGEPITSNRLLRYFLVMPLRIKIYLTVFKLHFLTSVSITAETPSVLHKRMRACALPFVTWQAFAIGEA